jgi:hypothetical protein
VTDTSFPRAYQPLNAEMAGKAVNGQMDARKSSFTGYRQMLCLIVIPRKFIMTKVEVTSQGKLGSAGVNPSDRIGFNILKGSFNATDCDYPLGVGHCGCFFTYLFGRR